MDNNTNAFTSSVLPPGETGETGDIDLVVFSHLRWDFVYQRPQHLLSRCARKRRVFFIEEPIFGNCSMRLDVREADPGVHVVVPYLPEGLKSEIAINAVMKDLTRQLFLAHGINEYVFWYYTPMALSFTDHFNPVAAVYDCMDELSAFKGSHSQLPALVKELFQYVDLVFTGGQSLYEAKRGQHPAVYAFPSSIDASHFGKARKAVADPEDQAHIPHPRLGFFGVIDERFDVALLDEVAVKRPDWHFVMIGPVVKIDPDALPKHPNIHYLGGKKYSELPEYLASWDIALLLFARNESTRYISPTKTPEYLAAGKPVISTSIRDVVRPYGELNLVEIADTADVLIRAAEKLLSLENRSEWLRKVDAFLENISWDKTWAHMSRLIDEVIDRRRPAKSASIPLNRVSQRAGVAASTR
jgi:UDP-galactopyranose mutase